MTKHPTLLTSASSPHAVNKGCSGWLNHFPVVTYAWREIDAVALTRRLTQDQCILLSPLLISEQEGCVSPAFLSDSQLLHPFWLCQKGPAHKPLLPEFVCVHAWVRDWTFFLLHALQAPLCLFLPKLFQRVDISWKQIGSGRLCHGATPGFAKQRARQREKGKWMKG